MQSNHKVSRFTPILAVVEKECYDSFVLQLSTINELERFEIGLIVNFSIPASLQ
jgi:hypothetical protein